MQTKTSAEQEVREVTRWRREQLAEAGFSRSLAMRVANDPLYDLHALIDFVEQGCSPELAVRILGPLEQEPDAV
jgi:hypothetical protein